MAANNKKATKPGYKRALTTLEFDDMIWKVRKKISELPQDGEAIFTGDMIKICRDLFLRGWMMGIRSANPNNKNNRSNKPYEIAKSVFENSKYFIRNNNEQNE